MKRILLLLAVLMLPAGVRAQRSDVHRADQGTAFDARWDGAWEAGTGARSGFWIGYRIERWMEEGTQFMMLGNLSVYQRGGDHYGGRSLYEQLTGEPPPRDAASDKEAVRREAERALARMQHRPPRKVLKGVAVLFRYPASARGPDEATSMWVGNLEMPADLDGRPLYWLGDADNAESLALLRGLYARTGSADLQESLVEAIGAHSAPVLVVPFLQDVLASRAPDDVREEAASWLGEQEDERVVPMLAAAVRTDRSVDVREEAVEALGRQAAEGATDALIDLARTIEHRGTREEIAEALGNRRTPRAVEALERMAFEDPDVSVQEEAVEALAEGSAATATPILVRIARTHRRPAIREEALEALAEVAPADVAVETLAAIAFEDPSASVQEEALDALAELPGSAGIPALINVARTHPRRGIREEAIEHLGESSDRRARKALEEILDAGTSGRR